MLTACTSAPSQREPLPRPEMTAVRWEEVAKNQNRSIDLAQPLAPEALASIAIYTNPDLKTLRLGEQVANAQIFAAGLYPDPSFSLGIDKALNGEGLVSAITASLGLDFAVLAHRSSAIKAAKKNRESVRFDIAWAEWLTGEQAKLLSTRIVHLRSIQSLTARLRLFAERELSRAADAVSRGDLPAVQLEARRLAATDAVDRDQNTEQQLHAAELELNRVLGLRPTETLSLADSKHPRYDLPETEPLFQHAVLSRCDLAGLRAAYERSSASMDSARLAQYPLPSLSINAARDTGKVKTLGPSLSFVLPIWNRGRGDLAIAQATHRQLRANYSARLESIRADIAAARSTLKITRLQLKNLSRQITPLSLQAEAAEHAASRGDLSFAAAKAVRMTVLDKQIVQAELAKGEAELAIALEISVGSPLETLQ